MDNRGIDTGLGWINREFTKIRREVEALRSERRIPGSGIDYAVAARASEAAADAIAAAERAEQALAAATIGVTSLSPLRAALGRHRLAPARIGFYGSSTTFGTGASDASTSYVNILARRFQSAYPSVIEGYELPVTDPATLAAATQTALLPGVQVVNGGVLGYTSATYIDATALTHIATLQHDCVVHMIGSNDYWLGVAPSLYKTRVEASVDAIDAAITKPTCHVLVHSYRRLDVTTPAYLWSEYADALRAIAVERDNVFFIDLSAEYEGADYAGADPYQLMTTDLIHQADSGHALTADLIYRAVTPASSTPTAPLVLSDSFTRPNGAVGSAEYPAGSPWTALTGTWAINGKQLGLTAGGTIAVESGISDLDVTAVITPGVANPIPGLLFRVSDDSNRLGFFLNPGASIAQIFRMDSGVNTAIATASYTFTRTHYVLRVIVRGDRIVCFINGARVLSHTLTSGDQTKFGVFTKVGFRSAAAPSDLRFWGLSVRRPL